MKNVLSFFVLVVFVSLFFVLGSSCNKQYVSRASPWDSINIGPDSISFIVMGDWGKYGGQSQKPVADAMNEYSKKFNAQFIITTGDNFYPTGVSSTSDSHWQLSFENVYNKEGHQIPWYPVLGNHDYQKNPNAEIEYSTKSDRWKMPARYYTVKKNINLLVSALFVFTDTSPFVKAYYGAAMSDLPQQDTAAQLRWLQETLSTSKDSWKLVFGHHPVYSVGHHAHTPELIELFKPLFNQTRTDFYIAGHDHSLQYITWPNDSVQYLISGGGSESTPVSPQSYTPFARSSPGFLVMTLYSQRANFYFYNQRGELLYRRQVLR
jgi:tartrate-resistant acid phosphatase type 5